MGNGFKVLKSLTKENLEEWRRSQKANDSFHIKCKVVKMWFESVPLQNMSVIDEMSVDHSQDTSQGQKTCPMMVRLTVQSICNQLVWKLNLYRIQSNKLMFVFDLELNEELVLNTSEIDESLVLLFKDLITSNHYLEY